MTPSLLVAEKKQIADSFSHAADQYDKLARLQKKVARRVGEQIPTVNSSHHVLDLGCGTADIYSYFNVKPCYTGLDISNGMLRRAEQKFGTQIDLINADAESLPFQDSQFDFIVSSLALQWCDLSKVIGEAYRVLKPGGKLVFSTLLDGTLIELNTAWQQVDANKHVNQFMTQTELSTHLIKQTWSIRQIDYDTVALDYPNVLSVMRELKGIGANHIIGHKHKSILTKEKLKALEAHYPMQGKHKNVTWQLAYITLTK